MEAAKSYCDKKISFLKANHDKLVEVFIPCLLYVYFTLLFFIVPKLAFFQLANEKANTAEQVAMVMQAKLKQMSK